MKNEFIGGHGTTGLVEKADHNTLIVKRNDNVKRTILVNNETID